VILDTNALSAIVDGDPKIAEIEPAPLAIPVVVLGEFRFGVAQSKRRDEYAQWLKANLSGYDVLHVTEGTALHYAEIRLELKHAGRPIPTNDTWIAALCREHRRPLLSRDRRFDAVKGLRRIGW
jgi:tRNA(fMet)-specific endonuclease VapC